MAPDEGHEGKQREAEHAQVTRAHDISTPQAASWAGSQLVHHAPSDVDLGGSDTSTVYRGKTLRCRRARRGAYCRSLSTYHGDRRSAFWPGGRPRPGHWGDARCHEPPVVKAAAESESAVREFVEQSRRAARPHATDRRRRGRLSGAREWLELWGFERTVRAIGRRRTRERAASAARAEW